MNKQEIEKEINLCKTIIDFADAELMKIVRESARENLVKLQAQLAEAEKPKHRHGDFGVNEDGNERIVLFQNGENGGRRDDYGQLGVHSDTDITIFGNIFDLMKDWGEDLERANIDGFVLEICGDRIVIGGRRFFIDQAEKFWHKLGQMIATLKRKQSST